MPAKILIVDDEADAVHLFRQRFRKKIRHGDFHLEFAQSAGEALTTLESQRDFDLVLTDINMPGMDGLTLLGEISKIDELVLAVVVSAYGDMQNIRSAMNRGAFDFITKPIDFHDLEITIEKALRQAERIRETLYLQQEKARLESWNKFIRDVFGRYVAEEVVNTLLETPEGLELGGEKRTVSILMTDLRGFTSLSERVLPEQVVAILNRYLSTMIDLILKYEGTINEILGDGILVFFGAPISRDDDAERAVACALEMQLAMAELNAESRRQGLPEVEMGIGINTGPVVAGNIGSQKRMKYTVVGSQVNLAARIEGQSVGGQILISESTLEAVGREVVRYSQEISLTAKGFAKPLKVYSVRQISGSYNLALPDREKHLVSLDEPLEVRFMVGEKSYSQEATHAGEVVKLARKDAVLHTAAQVDALQALRLQLVSAGETLPEAIYARVMESHPIDTGRSLTIRFTSIPPEAEAIFDRLLPDSSPSPGES